jgi:hypothetical protein
MRPHPEGFRQALRSALTGIPSLRSHGEAWVSPGEMVSRNTIIYRCRIGTERLVAKVQPTRPRAVALAEFQMLQDLQRTLGTGQVRAVQPVAYLEDLGVLVTREESGRSLRDLVEDMLRDPGSSEAPVRAAIKAAAEALRLFHDRYRKGSDVRWYMDFSTKNILITHTLNDGVPEVVLMDPPEEELWGCREEDIGILCFDLARIRFLPQFVWRSTVPRRLDRLKALFIYHYYSHEQLVTQSRSWDDVLDRIGDAELRRVRQTLRWYLKPWRYERIGKEILRSCYLIPLTTLYHVAGHRRSREDVGCLLAADEFGGEP